jgi:glutamine synthetase
MMAGLVVAARIGFEMDDVSKFTDATYINGNINAPENAAKLATLQSLPESCPESADALQATRSFFEAYYVFPASIIDATIADLKSKK